MSMNRESRQHRDQPPDYNEVYEPSNDAALELQHARADLAQLERKLEKARLDQDMQTESMLAENVIPKLKSRIQRLSLEDKDGARRTESGKQLHLYRGPLEDTATFLYNLIFIEYTPARPSRDAREEQSDIVADKTADVQEEQDHERNAEELKTDEKGGDSIVASTKPNVAPIQSRVSFKKSEDSSSVCQANSAKVVNRLLLDWTKLPAAEVESSMSDGPEDATPEIAEQNSADTTAKAEGRNDAGNTTTSAIDVEEALREDGEADDEPDRRESDDRPKFNIYDERPNSDERDRDRGPSRRQEADDRLRSEIERIERRELEREISQLRDTLERTRMQTLQEEMAMNIQIERLKAEVDAQRERARHAEERTEAIKEQYTLKMDMEKLLSGRSQPEAVVNEEEVKSRAMQEIKNAAEKEERRIRALRASDGQTLRGIHDLQTDLVNRLMEHRERLMDFALTTIGVEPTAKAYETETRYPRDETPVSPSGRPTESYSVKESIDRVKRVRVGRPATVSTVYSDSEDQNALDAARTSRKVNSWNRNNADAKDGSKHEERRNQTQVLRYSGNRTKLDTPRANKATGDANEKDSSNRWRPHLQSDSRGFEDFHDEPSIEEPLTHTQGLASEQTSIHEDE